MIRSALERLFRKLEAALNGGLAAVQGAQAKANEAQMKADAAQAPEERAHHEAVARVWRSVAEDLRRENERLRDALAAEVGSTQAELEDGVASLRPAVGTKDGDVIVLTVADERQTLPRLPVS
jgi:uncharacterized protein YlxW (UPF0749 family)